LGLFFVYENLKDVCYSVVALIRRIGQFHLIFTDFNVIHAPNKFGGGLAPSSQTVGSLLRTPLPLKPARKMIWA